MFDLWQFEPIWDDSAPSARTIRVGMPLFEFNFPRSCRPFQRHNRQVPLPGDEFDIEFAPVAGLAGDQRLWRGTRRRPWPVRPRFDAWPSVGRTDTVVGLVRRHPIERRVRAMLVVPADEVIDFPTKGIAAERHEDPPQSTYDDANQLVHGETTSGRTTYTFDADGNQQIVLEPSGDRTTNVWDYENRNTLVVLPSGDRVTMAYNPDNRRVRKNV